MTVTIAFSTPETLAKELDKLAEELQISRSSLLTLMISQFIKWDIPQAIKQGVLKDGT